MLTTFQLLLLLVAGFTGFVYGSFRKDLLYEEIARKQQKRGDYWFRKYQRAIRSNEHVDD